MASSALTKTLLVLSMLLLIVKAQVENSSFQALNESVEWPSSTATTITMFMEEEEEEEEEFGDSEDEDQVEIMNRRSLWARAMHYYISYGALSANRVPCPPRSGRSYYTNNCFQARGPVHPYTRGCSRITRCRR